MPAAEWFEFSSFSPSAGIRSQIQEIRQIRRACEAMAVRVAALRGLAVRFVDPNDANDQRPLFNKIKAAPAAAFLPKDRWPARLISGTRSVPEPALKDMLAAYDAAKKKAEQIMP